MKKIGWSGLIQCAMLTLIAGLACNKSAGEENVIKLKITGMTCNHCVETVTKALQSVEGVDSARVDLASDSAYVHFGRTAPSAEEMVAAVKKAGYDAEIDSN